MRGLFKASLNYCCCHFHPGGIVLRPSWPIPGGSRQVPGRGHLSRSLVVAAMPRMPAWPQGHIPSGKNRSSPKKGECSLMSARLSLCRNKGSLASTLLWEPPCAGPGCVCTQGHDRAVAVWVKETDTQHLCFGCETNPFHRSNFSQRIS